MEGRRRLGVPGVGCPGERRVGLDLWQIRDPLRPSTETSLYGEVTDTTLPGKAPKLQLTQTVP